jgi:hypothetical protein
MRLQRFQTLKMVNLQKWDALLKNLYLNNTLLVHGIVRQFSRFLALLSPRLNRIAFYA